MNPNTMHTVLKSTKERIGTHLLLQALPVSLTGPAVIFFSLLRCKELLFSQLIDRSKTCVRRMNWLSIPCLCCSLLFAVCGSCVCVVRVCDVDVKEQCECIRVLFW